MTTPTVWVAINRRSGTVLTARETREAARNYVFNLDDDAESPEDVEKYTDFVEYVPAELLRQVLASRDADMAWARDAGITLDAVGDILSRLEGEDISRGRAVKLLRDLAVAAVEERTRERDEARRELRALEWLHRPHRDGRNTWFNEHGQPCRYEGGQWVTWSSYSEAATALGWKDEP